MCLFIAVLLFGVKNKFIPDDLSTYCNFIVRPHETRWRVYLLQCYCWVSGTYLFQVMCLIIAMLLFGIKNDFVPGGVSMYCSVIFRSQEWINSRWCVYLMHLYCSVSRMN